MRLKCFIISMILIFMTRIISAQEQDRPLHFLRPSEVITEKGIERKLPPGYFISEPLWDKLDIEFQKLESIKIRLEAENKSLKNSMKDTGPGLGTYSAIALCFLGGIALGVSVAR